MAVLKLLFYLVVLVLILFLAYYTTRLLGNGLNGKQQSGNMKILDRLTVGRDSYLLVVSVGEQIFLVGVSPAGIVKLEELESYEKMNPAEAPPDFAAILAKQVKTRFSGTEKRKKNGSDEG